MTQHTSDDDWLYPEPPTTEAPAVPAPFAGCWRCDDVDTSPVPFASMIEATGEPPASPEAEVYGGGALLAKACEDEAVWQFTDAGLRRLSREAHGVRGAA